ncbi:MAG: hypothetical protein COA36_09665 [Desulfotalea sp.]|nr:MAG: hypothetical protein COA36_09665 [Desulfotalea sp.]
MGIPKGDNMYSSLIDAPVNAELKIVKVVSVDLTTWLNHLGLFVGSQITRHDDEINFHPVRIRGEAGDVVVPSGLGIKTVVHLENGERKPLTEMNKKDIGHLETIAGGRGCEVALTRLGLKIDSEITFLRALPHMDYIVVINQNQRTRISEGEAARIWGSCEGEPPCQFYFAKRGKTFTITEILGGRGVCEHLATHGISLGESMVLEGIEQAQEAHAPSEKKITVSSKTGLRLYLNLRQAGQIVVKSSETDKTGDGTHPRNN